MTLQFAITTFVGAMIFPLMIDLGWGKLVDNFGPAGGFMAALFIVGTTWVLNHGFGLIHQTGAWVDMGMAAGVGLYVAGVVRGNDAGKGAVTALYALIGGTLGGFIISLMA